MSHRKARWPAVASAVAVVLAVAGISAPAMARTAQSAAAASFATSFESGQPQPTWTSTTETGPGGQPVCSGVVQSAAGPAGMTTAVGSGPAAAYAAKTNAGFTGVKAFTYGGDQASAGNAYCDEKVFSVDIKVTGRTQLSYDIMPVLMNQDLGAGIPDPSADASIDLAFSDGTYLSQLHAVDGNGYGLTAAAQGAGGDLYPNQWNQVTSDIGAVAAGKTITRILVDYNHTGAAGSFQGWIDDLNIDGSPPQPSGTHLADYALTTSGTQSDGSYSRGNNIPATAVPHGFNFLTPVTNSRTTSWVYSYSTDNDAQNRPELQALAISHEPSPRINDRDTFQVMPGAGTAGAVPDMTRTGRQLPFSHSDEVARPYYYGVTFANGVKAEMTPTDHAAMFRFPLTGASSNLIFDNINNNGGLVLDPSANSISGYSDVQGGYGAPGDGPMYFYATFSQPVTASGMVPSGGCANSACAATASPATISSTPRRTRPSPWRSGPPTSAWPRPSTTCSSRSARTSRGSASPTSTISPMSRTRPSRSCARRCSGTSTATPSARATRAMRTTERCRPGTSSARSASTRCSRERPATWSARRCFPTRPSTCPTASSSPSTPSTTAPATCTCSR